MIIVCVVDFGDGNAQRWPISVLKDKVSVEYLLLQLGRKIQCRLVKASVDQAEPSSSTSKSVTVRLQAKDAIVIEDWKSTFVDKALTQPTVYVTGSSTSSSSGGKEGGKKLFFTPVRPKLAYEESDSDSSVSDSDTRKGYFSPDKEDSDESSDDDEEQEASSSGAAQAPKDKSSSKSSGPFKFTSTVKEIRTDEHGKQVFVDQPMVGEDDNNQKATKKEEDKQQKQKPREGVAVIGGTAEDKKRKLASTQSSDDDDGGHDDNDKDADEVEETVSAYEKHQAKLAEGAQTLATNYSLHLSSLFDGASDSVATFEKKAGTTSYFYNAGEALHTFLEGGSYRRTFLKDRPTSHHLNQLIVKEVLKQFNGGFSSGATTSQVGHPLEKLNYVTERIGAQLQRLQKKRENPAAAQGEEEDDGISRTVAGYGELICVEKPTLSVAYPQQLVTCVKNNQYLRGREYNEKTPAQPSSVAGIDQATFSKYLSIGTTYSTCVPTFDQYGAELAFYPMLTCVRHSCVPNSSIVIHGDLSTTFDSVNYVKPDSRTVTELLTEAAPSQRHKFSVDTLNRAKKIVAKRRDVPRDERAAEERKVALNLTASALSGPPVVSASEAQLRCWAPGGITEGDEVTVLLPKVDRPEFFLLPTDRREKLLKKLYHTTCGCRERCAIKAETTGTYDLWGRDAALGKYGSGSKGIKAARRALDTPRCRLKDAMYMTRGQREASLSGAFFGKKVETAAERERLTTEMRTAFTELNIVDPNMEMSLLKETPKLLQQSAMAMSGRSGPSITQQYRQHLAEEARRNNPDAAEAEPKPQTFDEKLSHHRRLAEFLVRYHYHSDDGDGADFDHGLRLHRHHWRLSLVRNAFLLCSWHYTFSAGLQHKKRDAREAAAAAREEGSDSDSYVTEEEEEDKFDFCSFDYVTPREKFAVSVLLDQIATDSLFMPPGHPHSLRSYRWFRRLTRVMQDDEAADLHRAAGEALGGHDETSVQWDLLKALDSVL